MENFVKAQQVAEIIFRSFPSIQNAKRLQFISLYTGHFAEICQRINAFLLDHSLPVYSQFTIPRITKLPTIMLLYLI